MKTVHVLVVSSIGLSASAQSLPPKENWGPAKEGVHVSLSLDKLTYALGEDIPLHVAAQVLTDKRPVHAVPDMPWGAFFAKWDFSRSFHLTIIDEQGLIIGNTYPSNIPLLVEGSSGPLLCQPPLEAGRVYTLDLFASRQQKTLPTKPGTYHLTVTWSPYPAADPPCDNLRDTSDSQELRSFVTVSSVPITIQVTGNP